MVIKRTGVQQPTTTIPPQKHVDVPAPAAKEAPVERKSGWTKAPVAVKPPSADSTFTTSAARAAEPTTAAAGNLEFGQATTGASASEASVADRLLNRLGKLFGKDRELDQLSSKVNGLKEKVMSDNNLTPQELQAVRAELGKAEAQFVQLAADRGFPMGEMRPTTPKSFEVYKAQQQIHFDYLAGKDLKSGVLGELRGAMEKVDPRKIDQLSTKIAADLVTSSSPAIAKDKMGLLRATLATSEDRALQLKVMGQVREKLGAKLGEVGAAAISLQAFDEAATFKSAVSVQRTELPAEVKGNNKIFPNRPIPGWEATNRAAVKASFDDLAGNGQLFLSKIPPGGSAKVAIKLDLNVGADGPPSVTDPAGTAATVAELLERADKEGKTLKLTVGDSGGFENGPLGRTTMDVMRDTGNYHFTLKAGLQFEAAKGQPGAAESLAKIQAAEARGVYFGSKDDKLSTPADLAAAEQAASRVVECVDYDKAGFVKVLPELGPIGLAAHGTHEFQMAKTWVEADFRVHATRGLSNHILANYTGAQKGLIGLHAIGLRPLDQGNDKRGRNPIDSMNLITKTTGLGTLFSARSGEPGMFKDVASMGDKDLTDAWKATESKWDALKGRKEAYEPFKKEITELQNDLNRQRDAGLDVPILMEKMRSGIREALERADATNPGFKQAFWDTAHDSTRVALRVGWGLRKAIPDEIRDEAIGARIGLLSQLPYQSDLVVQTQPKIGEGGGPDAYRDVRDVGAIIVGTNEASTDALAWELANKEGSMWKDNHPARFGLVFGVGPMHNDEIQRLDQ